MKKQLELIVVLLILISIELDGCNEVTNTLTTEKKKFIGTWYKSNYLVMDLFSNGTCSYLGQTGTWDVRDKELILKLSSGYNPIFTYAFSDNDLTLKLTLTLDGSTTVYTKRGEP